MRRTRLTLAAALVASAALVGLPTMASAAPATPPPDIPVQLLGMNDFHGRISDTTGSDSQLLTDPGPDGAYGTADDVTTTVGGSASVATTVQSARAAFLAQGGTQEASLFVGAGDLISASPFDSSVFRDEPTIEVLNAMGLDVSSVGNHEFDRGTEELRRISAATDDQYSDDVEACPATLGGEPFQAGVDGCFPDSTGADFHGTDYPYLAANVIDTASGQPMLPPYEVFDVGGGKKMALIGVVTKTTPTIVSPAGITDVEFIDEAEAVNRWVPVLQAQGIEAIGVLIHEGGENEGGDSLDVNGCDQLTGPIVDINADVSPAVDLIISGHSHQAYNCMVADPDGNPRLLTQAGFYGRLISDIRLVVDGTTGDVDRLCGIYQATNVPVTRNAPDPDIAAIVGYWQEASADAGDVVEGTATADIRRAQGTDANGNPVAVRDGESSLGNLVAQAQLEALQSPTYGDPVIAFMNPGGLRTDIAAGDVTYADLFAVQPFGNTVNAITLTGADIRGILEQQFQNPGGPRASNLRLGTSEGFAYSFDVAQPYGQRVDPTTITLNGTVIDPTATYRVVANSFLIAGGDSFTAFTNGTDPTTGPVDVDTAVAYFEDNSPVAPPAADHGTPDTFATAPAPAQGLGGSTTEPEPVGTVDATSGALGVAGAGFTCPAEPGDGGGNGTPGTPGTPGTQPVANPGNGIGTGQLANTGAATGQLTALGVGLLLAGGVATVAGYRRGRGVTQR
ncbi:bifunctional UDP-sugar hydrolase/5'-nucleotidase [Klenkia sp. PcliD-1-E]|uniref:bifunctional metallophosphatase/5'-nucleotidase n=1 Tax=Klenkia sp. PcliD-1-E TaxID=2954492 RepID=UPI0020978A88|nr:bifunctional metallophosphatase/5'-nucleotidase [Klenkia sp. PcliD-1-E]MCO7219083.1 bifunctional metallophosphatase/5'-nucleotidase [Klenkia sp. PcliD-1-E]